MILNDNNPDTSFEMIVDSESGKVSFKLMGETTSLLLRLNNFFVGTFAVPFSNGSEAIEDIAKFTLTKYNTMEDYKICNPKPDGYELCDLKKEAGWLFEPQLRRRG